MFLKFLFLLILPFATVIAKDFGVCGHLFEIAEEDISKVFSNGLKEPSEKKKAKWRKTLEKKALRPEPVSGLQEAKEYKSFFFDPTFVFEEEISDDRGNVLARAGDTINPCAEQKLRGGLLFFDGDMPEHIKWAEGHSESFKWILVSGSPIELEERQKEEKEISRSVYFDQGGMYTKYFGVEKTPCRISQEGDKLLVEEIPTKRKKNA